MKGPVPSPHQATAPAVTVFFSDLLLIPPPLAARPTVFWCRKLRLPVALASGRPADGSACLRRSLTSQRPDGAFQACRFQIGPLHRPSAPGLSLNLKFEIERRFLAWVMAPIKPQRFFCGRCSASPSVSALPPPVISSGMTLTACRG